MTIQLGKTKTQKFSLSLEKGKTFLLYLCGPTVYNDVHIGNLRGSFLFDLLTRLLQFYQIPYLYYQNITDIDSKIISIARTKKLSPLAISDFYYQEYLKVFQKCQLLSPQFVKVSAHLPAIFNTISTLLQKKNAYQTKTGIYFDTKKVNYVPPQTTQSLQTSQEAVFNQEKKNPLDFALWKFDQSKFGWQSPWGWGLPGWHTECVALIDHFIGRKQTVIHGGGTDLYFPHHWNEKIQFQVLYEEENYVDFWLYNGLVNHKTKISKSMPWLDKIFLAKNFLDQYSANFLRFFFYLKNYHQNIEFTQEYLTYCQQWEKKLASFFKQLQVNFFCQFQSFFLDKGKVMAKEWKQFLLLLEQDLNTSAGFDLINQWIKASYQLLKEQSYQKAIDYGKTVWKALILLGFDYQLKDYDQTSKLQLREWTQFLKQKNFIAADRLRQILQKKKILL